MKNRNKHVLAYGVLVVAAGLTFATMLWPIDAKAIVPNTIGACPPYCSSPAPRPTPSPVATPTPSPVPTPNAQQVQQLQSRILSVTPGAVSSGICIVTYQNYALASVQIGDTGNEELWEFGNGEQWLSIARVGGALTADLMTSKFNVPATTAQQLAGELDAASC